jgi:hypothetical protein
MAQDKKLLGKKLKLLKIYYAFSLLLILASVIITLIFAQQRKLERTWKEEAALEKPSVAGILSPSEALNNKSQYAGQRITLIGRVNLAPVVCQKQDCPSEDKCCGCPSDRDLAIKDAGVIFSAKTKELLKMLDKDKKSLCQRQEGGCDYTCPDWVTGGVYEVTGMFYAQSPPPGWKLSLEYYFVPEEKKIVQKQIQFRESLSTLFQEIKTKIQGFQTAGEYVLY